MLIAVIFGILAALEKLTIDSQQAPLFNAATTMWA
jgi:hypothetical protein